ncbi:MAG TPA: transglycosylase SLT domain-containing protein [Bacteroidota bacterium]|nr:transglycosylase SLT domain-containing protein [Bacteroidota bacterium]
MNRPILTFLFFVLTIFAGCTPSGENTARRADSDAEGKQVVAPGSAMETATVIEPATGRFIQSYGPAIKRYAERYGFDWRLVLAVMKQESRFSRHAESSRGATGLMQIMPVTSEELARTLDLEDLSHPVNNIQAGVFYLRKLYDLFDGASDADRIKLTLAAYNAGISRVYDAQEMAAYLHESPLQWQAVRDALPFLSKRFYTLHRSIWGQDKPKSGYFGNARQTINYVDAIMNYYDDYRTVLN